MKQRLTKSGSDSKTRIGSDDPRFSAYNPPMSLLQRHLAFWNMEEVERPLVGVYLGGYLVNDIYEVAQDGSPLLPDQLAPERFFELFWQDLSCPPTHRSRFDLSRYNRSAVFLGWKECLAARSTSRRSPSGPSESLEKTSRWQVSFQSGSQHGSRSRRNLYAAFLGISPQWACPSPALSCVVRRILSPL